MEQTGGRRVILSHHDFNGMPADLERMAQAMLSSGAEVVKLAVTAHGLRDCLTLREIGRNTRVPMSLIAMGEAGIASRVLASWMGSCWTYAGDGVAPGPDLAAADAGRVRVPAHRRAHRDLRRARQAGLALGVAGHAQRGVSRRAPRRRVSAAGRRRLRRLHAFADAVGLAGASVTAPFKVDAFERADECDPVSRRIQSVNTLRREGSRWLGCNTDVTGFLAPLAIARCGCRARAPRCSAPAAPRDRCRWRSHRPACSVTIAARRARSGAVGGGVDRRRDRRQWPPRSGVWDLLVNATPVGTTPNADASPLPDDYPFHSGSVGLRPGLQPAAHELLDDADARRLPDDRRPRHAGRAGAGAVRMVDRRTPRGSRDARGGAGAARGHDADMQKAQRNDSEADDVRRVRGSGQARDVRAGVQGARRRSADAGVGVPEGRRALRLRVPARERRRRRARRPLFVPRQGSVPDSSRPRRPDGDREGRRHDRRREAVRRHAARADEQLPVAVRAGPAALHRRRGRLPRLRHRGVVRADRRSARAMRRSIATTPASCCSTPCWRSITCSIASC